MRIYHRSYTLRGALAKRKNYEDTYCKIQNCPINDTKVCTQRGIIYEIKCEKCQEKYIGSTIRQLHIRVNEHLKSSNSSLNIHLRHCHNTKVSVRTLSHDSDPINLRFRESMYIRKLKPTINAKNECEEYRELIF